MKALKIIVFFVFAMTCATWQFGCDTAPGGTVATPYDEPGPYGVIRLLNQGVGTISTGSQGYAPLGNNNDPSAFTLYYPEGGQAGERFPLLTWGNGTMTTPTFYDEIIGHVVSYGFIVVCTNTGQTGTGEEMLKAVEWALDQNSKPGSPIYGMVDSEHIGAFGHSQGGSGTCMAAADPRIDAIAPLSGVPLSDLTSTESIDMASVKNIQCPAFFLTTAGEYGSSGLMGNMGKGAEDAFNGVKVPSVFAVTAAGDHGEYQDIADNVYFPYVTSNDGLQTRGAVAAWFDWQLKDKSELKSYFVGEDCELCNSSNFSIIKSKCFMEGCDTDIPVPEASGPTFLDEPGKFTVATLDTKMKNNKGTYPVTIYFPGNGTGQYPAIAFSPGLGANKDMYRWVGNHLASHGYTVLLFTVPWPLTLSTSQHEAGFVSAFALLEAENNNPESPLYGHVDLSRRAVMGHSLGGSACFRAAGAMDDLDAVIALAPAPVNDDADLIAVTEPAQIQTATRDCITGDELAYSYYELLSSDTRQIIDINGGNHLAFNDEGSILGGNFFDCKSLIDTVDQHQRLSRRYFTAWLDYYLKDDSTVEPYLFGEHAEQDLLSGLLTMWEFVRP